MRLLAIVALGFALGPPAAAQAPSPEAVAACEKAARETLRQARGAMADATFADTPVVQPGSRSGDDATLRGQGRYRAGQGTGQSAGAAPQAFSYSCMVNLKTAGVTGIVLRDATAAPAAPAASPAPRPIAAEPDLGHVAPEACDAAAASEAKRRWPQLGQLQFNVGARRLDAGAPGEVVLTGQGAAVPAPGQPLTHFSYRCTVDVRSGRVLGASVGP
ncbi:MAG TPA: hypothetical protein VFQ16_01780 [Burkholderiaceae bacterium]|nr:hypothetical protein [Burkholderiaceae bacterium]